MIFKNSMRLEIKGNFLSWLTISKFNIFINHPSKYLLKIFQISNINESALNDMLCSDADWVKWIFTFIFNSLTHSRHSIEMHLHEKVASTVKTRTSWRSWCKMRFISFQNQLRWYITLTIYLLNVGNMIVMCILLQFYV